MDVYLHRLVPAVAAWDDDSTHASRHRVRAHPAAELSHIDIGTEIHASLRFNFLKYVQIEQHFVLFIGLIFYFLAIYFSRLFFYTSILRSRVLAARSDGKPPSHNK